MCYRIAYTNFVGMDLSSRLAQLSTKTARLLPQIGVLIQEQLEYNKRRTLQLVSSRSACRSLCLNPRGIHIHELYYSLSVVIVNYWTCSEITGYRGC